MKKIIAAALVMTALCSCSVYDGDLLIEEEQPTTTAETEQPTTEFSVDDFMKEHSDLFEGGKYIGGKRDDDFSADVPAANGDISEDEPEPTVSGEVERPANCIDVPFMSQRQYPSGCELVSATMLLRFYGFEAEPADFISRGFISYQLLDRNGHDELFGGDPNKIFIGDPFDVDGYGCYSWTIFNGLKKWLDNEDFDTAYLTGTSLRDLCTFYIDDGQPVLIWATSGMEPTNKKTPITWRIDDTDELFTWIPNEHCMLLVGYDDENYFFNDPLSGQAVPYERNVTELRYTELGRQAVTIHPW